MNKGDYNVGFIIGENGSYMLYTDCMFGTATLLDMTRG